MPDQSDAIAAAVRAIGGESDLVAVMRAFEDWSLAHVIACAPDAHPVVQSIAALRGDLTDLLAPPAGTGAAPLRPDAPALHAALARVIGTPVGTHVLTAWAKIAPADWGRPHAAALRDAVQRRMCAPRVAAALIGPDDESAGLLRDPEDAAFAIRCWGRSAPAAPTAWADALSAAKCRRLLDIILHNQYALAACLPWLPSDVAHQTRIDSSNVGAALTAFAVASPTARRLHADRIRQVVAEAAPAHLAEITRLACAMQTDEVWNRVQMLIRESPDNARRVVAAASWDDLPEEVHTAILRRASRTAVCAAVAAARGRRDAAQTVITVTTAAAFFAALDPAVWDALDAATQRRCLRALWGGEAHLAVRALGLRPEVLVRARLDNGLVHAAQRHARDEHALRWALMSVALRAVDPDQTYALLSAMSSLPPDPGAFFCVANGVGDPRVIAPARAALHTPADLALAVALQRCEDISLLISACCAALQHALRGRSYDDLAPILALLTDNLRTVLMPDSAALVGDLAHPDRRDALRRTLDRLTALPPDVGVPVRVALDAITATSDTRRRDVADALARVLNAHGDVFLALAEALTDDLRAAVLPLPEDAALADALRSLAREDPPTAHRLAHVLQTHDRRAALLALHDRSRRDALLALLEAPAAHTGAVWQALSDAARQVIGAGSAAAASLDADAIAVRDPIAALALAAAQSTDADVRNAGVTALANRSALVRAIWDDLPPKVQQLLGALPACADLLLAPETPAIRRGRSRGRRA